MLLPALTVVCAIVAIAAALLGPAYTTLLFVFKPLTTVLVIAYAWPRGADAPRQQLQPTSLPSESPQSLTTTARWAHAFPSRTGP